MEDIYFLKIQWTSRGEKFKGKIDIYKFQLNNKHFSLRKQENKET